jgi:hypothetical protein
MIRLYLEQNGKFYTGPIKTAPIDAAFCFCVSKLAKAGYISENPLNRNFDWSFNTTLRCADEAVMSFMWKRMLAAEENDVRMIFSIFDFGGWRFFGRV